MRRDKNKDSFIKLLEEANKDKNDKGLKELIVELKKRRFALYQMVKQKKQIILAQKEGGKRGAKFTDPRGKGWADSFRINNVDIMLLWEEDLENDGNMVRMVDAFLKYDRYEMPYIL